MTLHDGGRCPWHRLLAAALGVACLGAPGRAAAQDAQMAPPSLAEIARKEVERRKAVKVPAKVYTDKGAKPAPGVAAGAAAPPAPPPPATNAPAPGDTASPVPKPAEVSDAKGESAWRARITEAREDLRRNEAFVEALQSRINGLAAEYSSRDDPYQRAKIGEDREKALAEQARVKNEIEAGKKLIVTIEEEARQAGVPPGWLR